MPLAMSLFEEASGSEPHINKAPAAHCHPSLFSNDKARHCWGSKTRGSMVYARQRQHFGVSTLLNRPLVTKRWRWSTKPSLMHTA